MRYEVVYSAHDGGWYCAVYDAASGVDVVRTKIYRSRWAALRAARLWVERNT